MVGIGDTTSTTQQGVWLDQGSGDPAPILVMRRGDKMIIDSVEHLAADIRLEVKSNTGGGTGGYGRLINDSGEILLRHRD